MESTFSVFFASIIGASWPKIQKIIIFCVWGGGIFSPLGGGRLSFY